ncbi:MAG: efflux RND transporter permease subunit, partial [Gemmatimonadetes bacterium]|nr:efflux RND transporter permease subunit [Gemmatimonadota bacterium]
TIVIVENVDRRLRTAAPGAPRREVVADACREVVRPIVFAISIVILVFLPLFTLQGVEGKTFRPLAQAVALAMAGSLVFALALAPLASDLLLARKRRGAGANPGDRPTEDDGPRLERWLVRAYRPLVTFFVRRPAAAIVLALGMSALGAMLLPRLGSEFTPKLREGTIAARVTMAPSISLDEARETTLRIERRLLALPDIEEVVSRVGRGEVGAHADPVNNAEVYVRLREGSRESQEAIEAQIRDAVADFPGVLVNLTQPIEMTVDELLEGVRAELAIKIFGEDLDQLRTIADDVAAVVREVPGAADVQVDQVSGTPQLLIRVDRAAIARWGLDVAEVQEILRAAVGGEIAGHVFEGVRHFPILVRYEKPTRDTPEAIRRILVPTPNRGSVPLEALVTMEEIVGPRQITRENSQRFITIQCNVVDRDIGTFVAEAEKRLGAEVDLPAGTLVTWGGQFRLQQEANRRLAVVVPATLLLIVLLLFASFRSAKSASLILLNIPLALVGGIAGLAISGQNLSVPASVGFIALFGIALENGMVL